jgi:hypothetical protein
MRTAAKPENLNMGSEYQEGMSWMRRAALGWPCKKEFQESPSGELRTKMVFAVCNPMTAKEKQEADNSFGNQSENLERLYLISHIFWLMPLKPVFCYLKSKFP